MTKSEKAIIETANRLRTGDTTVRSIIQEYNRVMRELTPRKKTTKKVTKK